MDTETPSYLSSIEGYLARIAYAVEAVAKEVVTDFRTEQEIKDEENSRRKKQ